MQQIFGLEKQLQEANQTINAKMRALAQQNLASDDLSRQVIELKEALNETRKELEAIRKLETIINLKGKEAIQEVRSADACCIDDSDPYLRVLMQIRSFQGINKNYGTCILNWTASRMSEMKHFVKQ
jgi:predicted  nucleic acid-binding Zn-ribbon protein